jgi:hypothetical protein
MEFVLVFLVRINRVSLETVKSVKANKKMQRNAEI